MLKKLLKVLKIALIAVGALAILLIALVLIVPSNSSVTHNYTTSDGETITIVTDTSGGYTVMPELPFTVLKNGESQVRGDMISSDYYYDIVDAIVIGGGFIVLDNGTNKDGNEYYFAKSGDQYIYALAIKDSKSGVVMNSYLSEKEVRECIGRISIKVSK